jgi:lysophospholipase L1-like esterase
MSILSAIAIAVLALGAAPAGAYTVMAIGDSITAGYVPPATPGTLPTYDGGYIPYLAGMLGSGYQFIGSQMSGVYNHEGYPGATTVNFAGGSGAPYIGNLASQHPNIMLIHLGTNDINAYLADNTLSSLSPGDTAKRVFESLLWIINGYSTSGPMDIYLAQIIPINTDAGRVAVNEFKTALSTNLTSYSYTYSNLSLHLVNMYGFPSTGYYQDDPLHPNAAGYQWMAGQWYTAITGNSPPTPTPIPAPVFLLGGGLAGLAYLRRRMGRKTS